MKLMKIKKQGVFILASALAFVLTIETENINDRDRESTYIPAPILQSDKGLSDTDILGEFAKRKKNKRKKVRKRKKMRKKVLTQSQSFNTKKNGKNKTNLDFDAVDVDGQRKTASGSMITNIKASDPDAMLPIRKNFRDVMSETSLIAED